MIEQSSKPIVWFAHNDLHRIGNLAQYFELHLGWTAPAEVRYSDRFRIVFVSWWQGETNPGFRGLEDLSWADLVVCMTSEVTKSHNGSSWPDFYREACEFFGNPNCVFVGGGRHRGWDSDRIFSRYRFFFLEVLRVNELTWQPQPVPEYKPYLFDVLMGKHKSERYRLLQWLNYRYLADRCLINMHANPYNLRLTHRVRSPELDLLEAPSVRKIWDVPDQKLPDCTQTVLVPTQDHVPAWASCVISSGIYQAAWYSIVFETMWSSQAESQDFITEKTAKPLYGGRVFVLLATPGSLSRLQEMGFETFGDVIDEGYDQIIDDQARMQAVQQQIIRLSELDPRSVYDRCQARLEHNHRHFLSLIDQKDLHDFLQYHIIDTIPREPPGVAADC